MRDLHSDHQLDSLLHVQGPRFGVQLLWLIIPVLVRDADSPC
jgi:hypothetical protein